MKTNLFGFLLNKKIRVSKLNESELNLRSRWETNFASEVSIDDKRKIRTDQYLWHVFSFEKLPHVKHEEARIKFNEVSKQGCYVFYQRNNYALYIEEAEELRAEYFDSEDDVYVTDKNFNWTYVKTHEDQCGPYYVDRRKVENQTLD